MLSSNAPERAKQSTQRNATDERNERHQDTTKSSHFPDAAKAVDNGKSDRLEEFERMQKTGAHARDIAKALGVTTRTVTRWRHATGTSLRPPAVTRPQSDRDFASRLLDDGCSIRETALTIGVSFATIVRWFPDAPRMTPQEAGHVANLRRMELQVLR